MQPRIQSNQANLNPNKKEWQVWWQLTRPHTLTASFVPVILGTVIAYEITPIKFDLFLAMLIASLLIQAATNMFNEYYDYKRGLDNEKSVGIGGTIVREGVHPKVILNLAITLIALSVLLGVYISMNSSWWVALVGSVSILIGYLYTGGPLPISSTPFGELLSGLFMGINIILISFYIQTGTITATSILVSIPTTILIGAINLSNNIRDLNGDKEHGRKTLPILVGRENAIKILAVAFLISYLWILALILFADLSPWLLVVFLSSPKAYQAVKKFIGKTIPIEMMPAMKATAQTNTYFGFLLSIGFIISYLF
ncbi:MULTISPECIES: 1,4-dihydroxy-2-naphthoate polyprenyltransferase [Bacillaceae]|uniref:1,4-dihydroxy-2-naphthoate octaprenyltransferase n=1 Tax=Caldibacillus thermoamylovorans TaxID=35841 RepID=A0A090IWI0_9BACI|nr:MULTISPECIES: 1,4-dihydroxy-2-naphthoate polyprenyltransferase [Bacillaceae]KIO60950.1 1,4-dihydroxy-2-naphthoate octaprenyltransferase [Caldibacillus thermoamylovorans]KIO69074.1 1,4-dihydroxy-2-naphthoate octaprenyltransferase [Caldibacillus thermoamylovorans]MCM3056338.1 1,4-dihydroxy-2-naphthoate polyprenyltransferase [Caldibacillus thermoamylovorans]CEE02436.1 putative 1,4-dihydroxy-2-naphthoate octaprenyltransferase [Caldibacillus thermoamylovorans]